MLTVSMMLDWRAFLFLVGLDAFFIALLLLFVLFYGLSNSKLLRRTIWLLLVFLSVTYLVDSFVLLALNQHAPLFDMGRYALEPGVVLSFFDVRAYTAVVLLLIALFTNGLFTPSAKRTGIVLLVIALSIAGFCSLYAPLPLTRYAMLSPVNLMGIMKPQPVVTSYSEKQIEFYASHAHDAVEIPATKPDILCWLLNPSPPSIQQRFPVPSVSWMGLINWQKRACCFGTSLPITRLLRVG